MNNSQTQHLLSARQYSGLHLARLALLLKQTPLTVASSLVLGFLITLVLWSEISQHLLITWLIIQSLIGLARIAAVRYIKHKLSSFVDVVADETVFFYECVCGCGAFCTGVMFGCLGLLLTPELSLVTQLIIPFALAGLTAGAIASSVSSLLNYYAFTCPALIILIYGLATSAMVAPAIMVSVYFVLMLILSQRINGVFVDSLYLKEHNTDLVGSLTDHNKKLEQLLVKLDQSEKLSSGAFNKAGVAMMLIDKDLEIFKVNDEACLLLGYNERQLTSLGLLNLVYPDEKGQSQRLLMDLVSGKRAQYQARKHYVRADQVDIWVQETVSVVINEQDEFDYAIVHAQDITQEYRLTQKLSYQANHDVVTGLLNRYAFETKMQSLILINDDISSQRIQQHVLCYIDLDQFKVVNDTFGHNAGDELLRKLAEIFRKNLRKSDLIARIGGDEFALLLFDCSTEAAEIQLEQLLQRIRDFTFEYEQQLITTTASIGLVAFDHTHSITEILKHADSACYAAKEAGRDRIHTYYQDDEYISLVEGEMPWISRIQRALTDKKFVLYYQKIVEISGTDALPHYELLIRMKGDDGKIIPPGFFLPAAEHYNLAAAIDLWVVDHTLATLSEAKEAGKNIRGVYGINLSGQSLGDKRFYEDIISRVNQHAHLSESEAYICFEITETAAISNMTTALHFIKQLRSMGCLFALDDFGSGLSSYAYLQQMPIDFLKIDGMFVKDCLDDPVKLEMIRSINSVGHVMGLKTIAEFVENKEIFDRLGEIDVDYAQGYWNGPPQPWAIEASPLNDIRPTAYLSA